MDDTDTSTATPEARDDETYASTGRRVLAWILFLAVAGFVGSATIMSGPNGTRYFGLFVGIVALCVAGRALQRKLAARR